MCPNLRPHCEAVDKPIESRLIARFVAVSCVECSLMMLSGYCQLQKSTFTPAISSLLRIYGMVEVRAIFHITFLSMSTHKCYCSIFEACEKAFEFSFDICTNTSRGLQQTVDS